MKRLLTTAALALLMTTAAHAKMVKIGDYGSWTAHYHSNDGRPMCSLSTFWQWQNGAVGILQFKWQPAAGYTDNWFTHVTKSNWRIPTGTEIPMTIWFDNADRSGNGTVLENHVNGSSTIETGFNNDASGILDDLANAKQLKITFNGGNEPAWVTKTMNGSRKAVETFRMCVNWVKNNSPTQPGAQSTQPGPAPTPPTQPGGVKPTSKKDDGSV